MECTRSSTLRKPATGLFVTGTDTGVGKTFVSAAIARQLRTTGRRVAVYKPVASGCHCQAGRLMCQDAIDLWTAAGQPQSLDHVCPQRFAAPLAPHLAAECAGVDVDERRLYTGLEAWHDYDVVLVEGAGGLLSPVTTRLDVADLVQSFGYPLIVVAPNRIGAINQVLLTVTAAKSRDRELNLAGIVLNDLSPDTGDDPSRSSNREQLEQRAGVPVLAHVRWHQASELVGIDWMALAAR